MFIGKRIDNGEIIYGGYYRYNDKHFIIQKDIWDIEPLVFQGVEVENPMLQGLEVLTQLLTDDENQPHQFINDPVGLSNEISKILFN